MATLVNKITIEVEPSAHTNGEPWSFAVRVPPAAVVDKIESLASTEHEMKRQVFASPEFMNAIMDAKGDLDSLRENDDFMRLMGDQFAANPNLIFDLDANKKERDLAELIRPFADDPVGFEPPIDWQQMEQSNPILMNAALAAAARRIFDWCRGNESKVRLKN